MAGGSSQDEGKNRRAKRQTSPMGEKREKRSRSSSNRRAKRQTSPMREKRQKTSRSMSNRRATRQASPMVEERPKRSRSRSNSRATRQTSPMGKFFFFRRRDSRAGGRRRRKSARSQIKSARGRPTRPSPSGRRVHHHQRTRQADASILRGTGDLTKSGPSVGPKER